MAEHRSAADGMSHRPGSVGRSANVSNRSPSPRGRKVQAAEAAMAAAVGAMRRTPSNGLGTDADGLPACPDGDGATPANAAKIRVICRLRPMSEQERRSGTVPAVTASTEQKEVIATRVLAERQSRLAFHFDHVLSSFSTQRDVFAVTLKPLLRDVLAGYEAAIFAYGQTGTGKTYTMEGDLDSSERRGLVPRAAEALIRALGQGSYRETSVVASCLEIYNEELNDLLAAAQPQLKIDLKETGHGVCCVGLSETQVSSLAEIQELIRRAQDRRRVAETRLNARSSRSHCLFTFKVTCRQRVEGGEVEASGKLHLVDLAGSECARNCGGYTSQEACVKGERERRSINQSLLTLGRVIAALRDESARVPYRDSKLTRMLQEALGGGCRTVMIATISPAQCVVDETISTLQYAEQATGIQNKPIQASTFRAGHLTPVAVGNPVGFGEIEARVDVHELELRLEYLTQEVEEAHTAFENKQREANELHAQLETTEAKHKDTSGRLEQAQQTITEQAYVFKETAQFADEKVAEVDRLSEALAVTRHQCLSLQAKIRDQKHQARKLCLDGEQHATVLARETETSYKEAVGQSDVARRTHRDGVEAMANAAEDQSLVVAQLVQAISTHGSRMHQELTASIVKLAGDAARPQDEQVCEKELSADRVKHALAALQRVTWAHVEQIEKHSKEVGEVKSQGEVEANLASMRRVDIREAVEQLVASYASSRESHVSPLRQSLQTLDEELATSGNALDVALASIVSELANTKSNLSNAVSNGEASVQKAITIADTTLKATWDHLEKKLVGLREVLSNAKASLAMGNCSEMVGTHLSDISAMVASSVGQELAALDSARKATADELSSMRSQIAVEQKILTQLAQQRDALTEEMKRAQASLARMAEEASSARTATIAVTDEQRRRREAALRAITKGVEDLVKGELQGLEEGLESCTAPVIAKLENVSALSADTANVLTAAEREAACTGAQISTGVSAWAEEARASCDNVQSAQEKAVRSAQKIGSEVDEAVKQMSGIGDQVRAWGSLCGSVTDTLHVAATSVSGLSNSQEACSREWETVRNSTMCKVNEWSESSNVAERGLDDSIRKCQTSFAKNIAALQQRVSSHSKDTKDVMLVLANDEEQHATNLNKFLELQTKYSDEAEHSEASRGKAMASLVQGAATCVSATSRHADQFGHNWESVTEAVEVVRLAAESAEESARRHKAAFDSVRNVMGQAEQAHRRSLAAMEAHSTHAAALAQLPKMWRDAVSSVPLAAFEEPSTDMGNDSDSGSMADVGRRRPSEKQLLVQYRTQKSTHIGESLVSQKQVHALAYGDDNSAAKENEQQQLILPEPALVTKHQGSAQPQKRAPNSATTTTRAPCREVQGAAEH